MRAYVIVDLGFGDAGKGLLTDFLVRETGAKLVVRYNGGAQAGHNVVAPDGRHHTFAQFGAGTLVPGVRTFLSRNVVVHPTALLRENEALRAIGVDDALDRIGISAEALVITPIHQELGRQRARVSGHGSCGVGVGATVEHALAFPSDAIRFGDLGDAALLRRKLARIREYADLSDEAMDRWCDAARSVAGLVGEMPASSTMIFEGAQGMLIDANHGFHPYTSWTDCTVSAALDLLPPHADVTTLGVLRTYAVRHGPGPLPTEAAIDAPPEHNSANEWQGPVRRGWFDAVLSRYAIACAGRIDALAITHLDWLAGLERWTYYDGYVRHCAATEHEVLATIEAALGREVAFAARGPRASSVEKRATSSAHAPAAAPPATSRRSPRN